MMIKTITRTMAVASFLAMLAVLAPGAMAQESGGGNEDRSDGRDSNDFSRQVMIQVQLVDSSRFNPRGLVLAWDGFNWDRNADEIAQDLVFININRPALQRDESKLNLGKIPLLGGLLRKTNLVQDTVSEDFRGSTPVGPVSRIGDTLLLEILPEVQADGRVTFKTVVIANGDYTYTLEGLMSERVSGNEDKVPWIADLPLVGEFFRIGEARQKGNQLLILIRPHLVEIDEGE